MSNPEPLEDEEEQDRLLLRKLSALADRIEPAAANLRHLRQVQVRLWAEGRDRNIQQKVLAKASRVTASAVSQALVAFDNKGD